MSIFNGIRQKLRGGADAGRGDQPYPAFMPASKIPGMPLASRRITPRTASAPLPKMPGMAPQQNTPMANNAASTALYDMATRTPVPKIPTAGNIGNMKYRSGLQSYANAHAVAEDNK